MRQPFAQVHVQVGKRLVEQQQVRLWGERARQRDALLLAAGELVRVAPLQAVEPDEREGLRHPFAPLRRVQVAQPEGDVAPHVQVRKQRVVLKDHANAPRLRRQVDTVGADEPPAERDAALGDALQPRDRAQQRRLAAARRADQHADVAGA